MRASSYLVSANEDSGLTGHQVVPSGGPLHPPSTENVASTLDGALVYLVVVILALNTARDLVAAFFGPFSNKWLSLAFPRKIERRDLEQSIVAILEEIGLNRAALTTLRAGIRQAIWVQNANIELRSGNDAIAQLIILLSRYTLRLPQDITYGLTTPQKSGFYINTMEAALSDDDCLLMARLLQFLMVRDAGAGVGVAAPSYFLSSKTGNSILVSRAATLNGACCILRKPGKDTDPSRLEKVSQIPSGSQAIAIANLEGAKELLARAGQAIDPLRGVLLDCNCSGGNSLRRAADEFNAAVADTTPTIVRPTYAYVLFRPDTNDQADAGFQASNIVLRRFFDLNEDLKGRLAALGELLASEGLTRSVNRRVSEIVEVINSSGLNRLEVHSHA